MSTQHYFEQTKQGKSTWWTWPTVFWLVIMTWLIGQFVFGTLMVIAGMIADPEIADQLMELSTASAAEMSSKKNEILQSTALMSSAVAFVTLLLAMMASEAKQRRMFGIITGVAIAASYVSLFMIFPTMMGDAEANAIMNKLIGTTPGAFAFMLLTFPAALVGLYLGQKFIHKRTLTSLHSAFSKFRWNRAIQAFFIMWAVLAGFSALAHFTGLSEAAYVFDVKRFFGFALVSLCLLPIQSATEEIVFRGYLNQGITHFTNNKWIAFVITSGLFMAMHLANPEAVAGAESGILPIVMSGYFFFGFAACLLVLIDDGLESAIGIHAGNNTFAAIFVNYENSVLPTPSVFQIKADPVYDSIGTIVILGTVVAIIYWLRRRQSLTA